MSEDDEVGDVPTREDCDEEQLFGEDSLMFVCVNAQDMAIFMQGVTPHIQTRSLQSQMKGGKP